MPKNNLLKIGEMSPGVATAAAQAGISKQEQAQIAAFAELKKTHEYLNTLSSKDAYKNYSSLSPEYQGALKSFFNPKYTIEDKGFIGNILRSAGNSANYAVQSFKELGMQIAGIPVVQTTNVNPAEALLTLGTAFPVSTSKETGVKTGAGNVLNALIRPQEKLVKQPYAAQRLSEEEGDGSYINYAKFIVEGVKELLPGGRDAEAEDASTTWKKYWEQASDKENVFDKSEVAKIDATFKPEEAMVGKILASRKNFVDFYPELIANPAALSLIQRYTSGDVEAMSIVGKAVAQYEMAKISPGRDVARALISVFPYEYERALNGDKVAKAFFNGISGGIDFGVTFGLDPLIIAGKAKRASDIARFGLIRFGEDVTKLERAWNNRSVRRYWDKAGELLNKINTGNLQEKGVALTRLLERFPEITQDSALYMSRSIKDADTALDFFRSSDILNDISMGNAGMRADPLIPRYTVSRAVKDTLRDASVKAITKTVGEYKTFATPSTVDSFARIADETPISWLNRIGYKEADNQGFLTNLLAGRREGAKFVSKDASAAARIDRFFRNFEIAPSQERLISLTDARSATQVYRLIRTVVDKTTASEFRAAWIGANEGQRLQMYKGLVKTLAYGMGFDHTVGGKKFIDEIEDMSKELYSVNQSSFDLAEFSRILGTTSKGTIPAPTGLRAAVAEASKSKQKSGLGAQLAASSGTELGNLIDEAKSLRGLKKDLIAKSKISTSQAEIDTINSVVKDIDKSLRLIGGNMGKLKVARTEIKKYIDDLEPIEAESYNAAEINGTQRAIRAYQLDDARYMPNLIELRKFELRGNIFSSITGRVGEDIVNQKITDYWSYLNLYPRLGIRTIVEEVGTAALISGAGGISSFIAGRKITKQTRKLQLPGTKTSAILKKEKEVSPLGILSRTMYKLTGKTNSREELIAINSDPEKLATAVGKAFVNSRFKPEFLQTAKGARIGGYAEDWVRNSGNKIMEEINGAATRAEFKISEVDDVASQLKQYGPSVALNVNVQEALKDKKFARIFSQISYGRPEFHLSWYLDLQNTIGRRNIFGQIVFSNIYKKEEDVIETLVKYIDGKGNDLAKRFAIYSDEGSYGFAKRLYADSTSTLRDNAGRLNKKLIEEIKVSGGIDNLDFTQLSKYMENFQAPKVVLGRELIPLQAGEVETFFDRSLKNGYGWIGRQIALLDREPITYGNYVMYREKLLKYENNFRQSLAGSGIDDATIDILARNQSHEIAANLARQRTLAFVDNSDIRTNLAFNIRNFGRYYRATEDFWRRTGRIAKYEKRAIVRLAILNQTFEHSGFVHKDDRGEMYFTYPGDDILNYALGTSVFRILGIPGAQPMSVEFGGKVKMLTPSLDPESAAPRLGGPFVGISLAVLKNLPVIGGWLSENESTITGGSKYQAWWRAITPINVQRLIDMGIRNSADMMTEQKFSATVQAMRLLTSTGNGPTEGSDLNKFYNDSIIQSTNIMALRFVTGLGAPASVQMFATKDVPKEMIDAGVFTWDSEFAKFVKRHANDPQAFEKALVEFATLYPSKTVYTIAKTTAQTEANFSKTYEAARFVKNNKQFVEEHKQAAAFFIPISGTSDIDSYSYLKSQGFVKNKQLEIYLREIASAGARKEYEARKDYYNNLLDQTGNPLAKRRLRDDWALEQDFFKKSYPLLARELEPDGYKALKIEALDDLRKVVYSGMSPDSKLGEVFGQMILTYDDATTNLDSIQGRTAIDSMHKDSLKTNAKTELLRIAGNNPNAQALYWSIFKPLIGD